MRKYIGKVILFFTVCLMIVGCGRRVSIQKGHYVFRNKPPRLLSSKQDVTWFQSVDTSALYLDVSDHGKEFLKFFSNGTAKRVKVNGNSFSSEDFNLPDNFINHLEFLIKGNKIKLDRFYPGEPTPIWDNWERIRLKGVIQEDTISLKLKGRWAYKYIKSSKYHFVDGKIEEITSD